MTLRQAIFDVLDNDAALTAIVGDKVFWRSAPQGTPPPVIIYEKVSGTKRWAFGGPPMRNEIWLIKGAGFIDDAEAIDERCQVLLDNHPLTVDGYDVLLKPMPDDEVSFQKEEYGETFDHVGTYYRVIIERASS